MFSCSSSCRSINLGEVLDKKLETGFVDGKEKKVKTRKRVATFHSQVFKGVKDMKVSTSTST